MTRRPDFITFTGVDDFVSFDGLTELSSRYPIEWAMLFSLKRQGNDPRYPSKSAQDRFAAAVHLKRAAHLCGELSDMVMREERINDLIPFDLFDGLDRIQVNHADALPGKLLKFSESWTAKVIGQVRGSYCFSWPGLHWLFDKSGGRGTLPESWPKHPGKFCGYAGGINPDNVASVLDWIDAIGPYWIDMETGVRTEDRLDLEKCRAVCEAVYGKRA